MPSLTGSEYSDSQCLSMVQPPSLMMDSLPSLTQPHPPVTTSLSSNALGSAGGSPVKRRPSDSKMECRHTVSAKVGSTVPLAVRRALGNDF